MTDEQKTKQELIQELDILKQRVADLKQSELARKRAEEALRESEEKYRAVFENTGAATVVIEENTIISLANAEFVRLSGYSPGEIEGKKSWTEFVVKEDLERMQVQHRLRGQNAEKALRHYEFRFVRRNRDIRNIYLSIDVILGTTKRVASLLDITERRQAEEALRESEGLYRTLIETSPDAIVLVDMNTNLIMVNQAAVRLYGYQNVEEMIGKTFLNLIVPEERPLLFEHFKDTHQTGSNQILEHTSLKKDGSLFHAAVNASLIFDAQGRPKGIVAIIRDMTEHQRAEAEREKVILQLQDALAKVKTLSGMLPICTSCKKIRDDKGYWNQIEVYIRDHSETEFTHGICPECFKKLYPDEPLEDL